MQEAEGYTLCDIKKQHCADILAHFALCEFCMEVKKLKKDNLNCLKGGTYDKKTARSTLFIIFSLIALDARM
jgi:hypothetical protein